MRRPQTFQMMSYRVYHNNQLKMCKQQVILISKSPQYTGTTLLSQICKQLSQLTVKEVRLTIPVIQWILLLGLPIHQTFIVYNCSLIECNSFHESKKHQEGQVHTLDINVTSQQRKTSLMSLILCGFNYPIVIQ